MPGGEARELANSTRVEPRVISASATKAAADAPCHRRDQRRDDRIRLRNISAMGALVECDEPVIPGQNLPLTSSASDRRRHRPLGADRQVRCPVHRAIRSWAAGGQAPRSNDVTMLQPWYVIPRTRRPAKAQKLRPAAPSGCRHRPRPCGEALPPSPAPAPRRSARSQSWLRETPDPRPRRRLAAPKRRPS